MPDQVTLAPDPRPLLLQALGALHCDAIEITLTISARAADWPVTIALPPMPSTRAALDSILTSELRAAARDARERGR
jgi:hypothetical protein